MHNHETGAIKVVRGVIQCSKGCTEHLKLLSGSEQNVWGLVALRRVQVRLLTPDPACQTHGHVPACGLLDGGASICADVQ
jgi:hypothetical protein